MPSAAADGVAAKKKTLHATERGSPRVCQARREYRQQIARFPIKKLKFVDESGLNIALTHRYGKRDASNVLMAL
jgi:hypothetical protein